MIAAVVVVAQLLSAQCSGAACPNPCRSCAFQPTEGTNLSLAELRELFVQVATRQEDAGIGGGVDTIEVGAARTRQAAEFPCRLLPAIGMAESSIKQFCDSGLSVISFDCGFGIMQVTSGAANYPGVESSAAINIAAGADILAAKWNGEGSFGGTFGDSDPAVLESWYFATWAYNGFVYSNNPNNPDRPANRPPFNSPASLPRGSYPYQEIVWGYLGFPQEKEGEEFFAGVDITYPDDVPNQSGLFSVELPLPEPSHRDSCVEVCPAVGCPPQNQRTLFLDDVPAAGSTFVVSGGTETHTEGGFNDRFLSVAPSTPATVTATWTGIAPASGTFDVAGFIPLSPAENDAIVVVVRARGQEQRFTLDQNVSGGFFQNLGPVVLLQGEIVTIVVDNASTDTAGRIGLDAFRLSWRGDGEVDVGGVCNGDVDCQGDGLCSGGVCVAGCEVAGCGDNASCDRARGVCVDNVGEGEGEEGEGEGGEGEGEGEGEAGELPPSVRRTGCSCQTTDAPTALGLLATLGLLRRRRR